MYSIIKNLDSSKTARFFLLVSGWGKKEEQKICKLNNCVIEIIHVEEYMHYFKNADKEKFVLKYIKSLAPYYRLLIPKILPENIKHAFYIDADMISDADISDIQNSVPSNILMASVIELVANIHYKTVLAHVKKWPEFNRFNADRFSAPYFNAGFFFMNLDLARKLNVFEDCMEFLNKHPNPPYADQDTLNAVCGQKHYDKMLFLHPRWNVFTDMKHDVGAYGMAAYNHHMIQTAFMAPYIYHYAGPNKPWINDHSTFYEVWLNYIKLSPFNNDIPQLMPDTRYVYLFGIPLIKVVASKAGKYKAYLFGFLAILRFSSEKKKFYLFGIPLVKVSFYDKKIRAIHLFNLLPIIRIKKRAG